jgi:hypothetical protein
MLNLEEVFTNDYFSMSNDRLIQVYRGRKLPTSEQIIGYLRDSGKLSLAIDCDPQPGTGAPFLTVSDGMFEVFHFFRNEKWNVERFQSLEEAALYKFRLALTGINIRPV